ncbi:DoxX-like family protein [Acinetobacter courvalinii]|uniref:DoxX-like family protein n=1 Tax=Acinetobacter courvalinii TaxID=280147 RepID=UPI0021CEF972|nr:DoxX-like family protein [Acinetobacter courvalinii]MCU4641626.1 DoxX-like family protein [Acinetobacter courvalinii]
MKQRHPTIHRILKFCQSMIALLWIYQGLIPKLIFQSPTEQAIWQQLPIAHFYIGWLVMLSGISEVIFGVLFLFIKHPCLHWLSIVSLTGLFIFILFIDPNQLYQAFNPVVMNIALASLSLIAIWCLNAEADAKPLKSALRECNKKD